jgi:arylsulfatase A-like enzyme
MNVVLLVIDSLRARSLTALGGSGPPTPFLDRLGRETLHFTRAYATDCWTLPSHASMFTGLLPSEHGAHFQHMALRSDVPTVAERLSARGLQTSLVTRNFVFDGTIPGITRGFQQQRAISARTDRRSLVALFLAAAKPRVRRHFRRTGFFHPFHRDSAEFLQRFARALLPADEPALAEVLAQMRGFRARRQPYFIFCNLYDVHAPYAPSNTSLLEPPTSVRTLIDNVRFPWVMSRLGAHTYLRPGFHLGDTNRALLLRRYERAIALMDAKLSAFHALATAEGLLDDTLLIVTSDHGEAFGEHDLYLHDASVYDTHLHVPLWIRDPRRRSEAVADVVSLRELAALMVDAGSGGDGMGTLVDPTWRTEHPVAVAEHFHYPHARHADPRYRQNVACAIAGNEKWIVRRDGVRRFDLTGDPDELRPQPAALGDVAAAIRSDSVVDRLRATAASA